MTRFIGEREATKTDDVMRICLVDPIDAKELVNSARDTRVIFIAVQLQIVHGLRLTASQATETNSYVRKVDLEGPFLGAKACDL